MDDGRFIRRHTCIMCGKKRYEAHMKDVGILNVMFTETRTARSWVCVKGHGYESWTNCGDAYRSKMETIGTMFERLADRR